MVVAAILKCSFEGAPDISVAGGGEGSMQQTCIESEVESEVESDV